MANFRFYEGALLGARFSVISENVKTLAELQQEFLLLLQRTVSLEPAEAEFYNSFYHIFNFEELLKIRSSIVRQEQFIGNNLL